MSLGLSLFGILCGALLIAMTFRSLFKRNISERQSLFWIFCGLVIAVACMFPDLSVALATFFGVEYAPSIIFMGVIILVIFGLFYCFGKLSKLYSRNRDLAIQVSMLNSESAHLKNEVRELKKQIEDLRKVGD